MTQPTGNEVAHMDRVKSLILDNSRQLTAAMPSHIKEQSSSWLASAMAAVQRNPDLIGGILGSPHTFANALNEAAQLGLAPGTPQYYLTPRKNKGKQEILGIIGYQGHIELMYRAGAIASVVAEVVYANDNYRYDRGVDPMPVHKIAGGNFGKRADRGALIGVYAYAVMKDGAVSRVVELNGDDIAEIKRTSQGSDGDYSPWKKWEKQMWLKSAVHNLEKWVPTSAEYAREKVRAVVDGEKGTQSAAAHQAANPAPTAPNPTDNQPNGNGGFEDMGEQVPGNVDPGTGEVSDPPPPGDGEEPTWGMRE